MRKHNKYSILVFGLTGPFIYFFTLIDINLCSHIWSICYLAQSVFDDIQQHAEPCSRRCAPISQSSKRKERNNYRYAIQNSIPMGQHTPLKYVCLKILKKQTKN